MYAYNKLKIYRRRDFYPPSFVFPTQCSTIYHFAFLYFLLNGRNKFFYYSFKMILFFNISLFIYYLFIINSFIYSKKILTYLYI